MSVVLDQQTVLVTSEDGVTVVGASPLIVVSEELGDGVSVAVVRTEAQVLPVQAKVQVLPVSEVVNVVSNPVTTVSGAKITVSLTAPAAPNIGDLWIVE